jgi:hypothetical protein
MNLSTVEGAPDAIFYALRPCEEISARTTAYNPDPPAVASPEETGSTGGRGEGSLLAPGSMLPASAGVRSGAAAPRIASDDDAFKQSIFVTTSQPRFGQAQLHIW